MGTFDAVLFPLVSYSVTYPLRALAPLCNVIVLYFLMRFETPSVFESFIFLYSAIEVAFLWWFFIALRSVQVIHAPPLMTSGRRERVLQELRKQGHGEKPFEILNAWFAPHALEEIGRDDLVAWFEWSIFSHPRGYCTTEDYEQIDAIVKEIESSRGIRFKDGCVPGARVMRINYDPVSAQHRPFVYYLAVSAMDYGSNIGMKWLGFQRHCSGQITYWFRGGQHPSPDLVVFVHGVGVGLAPYLQFIAQLSSSHSLLFVELPHVSMSLGVENIPTITNLSALITSAMRVHGFTSATWVGHSLGTCIVAAVSRLYPDHISGMILIDPVCFLLWEVDVVKNFCYRSPTTPMQIVQHYHISQELFISHYFHRHFWWHECVMFTEEVPSKSITFLSKHDDICNPTRVMAHLKSGNIDVRFFDHELGHGAWIVDGGARNAVINAISSLVPDDDHKRRDPCRRLRSTLDLMSSNSPASDTVDETHAPV